MKKTLKKILFIVLLFSAAVPTTMQASLDWAILRSRAIKVANFWVKHKTTKTIAGAVIIGCVAACLALFYHKKGNKKANKKELNVAFRLAIKNKDIEKIKEALKNGVNVNQQNENGDTALINAV